jgi:SNF2 family DNA or RNA helicase
MAIFRFKTPPWPHQVKALKKIIPLLRETPGAGLYVPMRWGKSKTAIDAASILYLKGEVTKVLVVTITSGIGVWENEIPKHCPVPWEIRLSEEGPFGAVHAGLGVPEYAEMSALPFHVVNYENTFARVRDDPENSHVWYSQIRKDLKKYGADFLIVDEAHRVGRAGSVQSKMVYNYAKTAKTLIMTGTPWHRKPLLIFGQFKVMDDSIFGTAEGHFKREHAILGGVSGKEVKRYRNLKRLVRTVRKRVFWQKYVPPGPSRHEVVPVHLKKSAPIYEKMALDSLVRLDERDTITAPIILTRHLRLLQIAGGWLKTERGTYRRVGREKIEVFEDWLAERFEENITKIVVGCRFIPELNDVAKAAHRVGYKVLMLHGGVKRGSERERRIAAFNTTDKPTLFISQIAAGKEAIDLSAASVMAFYSLPESYLDFDQFRARIEKYKDTRTLAYYYFLARGTQDQLAYLALKLKKDVADLIMERPDVVEQITSQI